MKTFILIIGLAMISPITIIAQDMNAETIPYSVIPDYPESYSPATVLARMIDGLGFRYYWASEGLTEEDLNYQFSDSSRTLKENIDHLYGLCYTISKTILGVDAVPAAKTAEDDAYSLRAKSLKNLYAASEFLKEHKDLDLAEYNIIFSRSYTRSDFPMWNLINGQIADALWHTGQVVASRRASGNPLDSRVSVFRGKLMEKK